MPPIVHGAIAAGHQETAHAGGQILRDGGNAFDAALGALAAACVAEPVLASLGGGGFLLAAPADGAPVLYDFFCQTPRRPRPREEIDFSPVHADFGTALQEFHIGLGAAATPGVPAGIAAVQADLGALPLARILEPATQLARGGVEITPFQSALLEVVKPIYLWSGPARALFQSARQPGEMLRPGERLRNPGLAEVLEMLGRDGAAPFYQGEVAREIIRQCAEQGGALTAEDLAGYRVARRAPLAFEMAGAEVLTNPAPSAGGPLIAFAAALFERAGIAPVRDRLWYDTLARVMALTNRARHDCGLDGRCAAGDAAARLASDDFFKRFETVLKERALKTTGTTHISVIDAMGNAAALTVSNGEGCGYLLGGYGYMLNNMLGEEDLNPAGFFTWRPDSRISSMMAPTIARRADGRMIALGSGGSMRIRSAIFQVLANLLHLGEPLAEAVAAGRLHVEEGLVNIEAGIPEDIAADLAAGFKAAQRWPEPNMFFGGVHAVASDPASAQLSGAGDPRRAGVAVFV
jgi:gamma-glutamyltranspeptidase/glutathione hydrolase